jgi:AAA domain
MKTVFIYGAPGVGKLTVAQELTRLTGFSVLHNHLFNDFVSAVFSFGTPEFSEAVHDYRLDLMERAAKGKVKGVILTFVYDKSSDDPYLQQVVRQARKHRGEILFVRLTCDDKELFSRVQHPSRKAFKKVTSPKALKEIMKVWDVFSDVPYEPNLVVDTSKTSAQKVAKLIQDHYKL